VSNRSRVRLLLLAVLGASFLIAGSAGITRASAGPCPGVPYAAPPAGAPAAPPVACGPGLLGIGNIGGPLSSIPKTGPQPILAPKLDTSVTRRLDVRSRSAVNATCVNGNYSYGYLWTSVSAHNPSSVQSAGTSVSGLAVSSPGSNEHVTGGMLSWQNSGTFWVQMGYARGNIGLPGSSWTDTLPAGYSEAYLEFHDTQGNYHFEPLLQVPYGQQHDFSMTTDSSAHYYNFYLDGVLKWANVYLSTAPSILLDGDEDYNLDGVCESGYSDNNYFSTPLGDSQRVHIDGGHAVGTVGSGPWRSDGTTYVNELSGLGYTCGQNSNGYYWWCTN
jgi:hypothetical protein